jgi:hypothetical protein
MLGYNFGSSFENVSTFLGFVAAASQEVVNCGQNVGDVLLGARAFESGARFRKDKSTNLYNEVHKLCKAGSQKK